VGDPHLSRVALRRLSAVPTPLSIFLRLLLPAALAVVLPWAAAISVSARPLDDVVATRTLRVVVYDDNKPFSWVEDGLAKGIEVDVARRLAAGLGVEADIISRTAGEEVDDDLRSNIWQGPRTGGKIGDVMMHVPVDKELVIRNPLVQVSNAYFHEQVVLVTHPDLVGADTGFAPFRQQKLAVQFASVAHYFIAFADEGIYRNNVNPYLKMKDAAESFLARENAGLLGRRALIEGELAGKPGPFRTSEPEMPGILKTRWTVGTAVKEDSRDLGYAIGNVLAEMARSGELERICAAYGVSYVPPPLP
jgi:ABC-type amino acid transport substrate-binding protein